MTNSLYLATIQASHRDSRLAVTSTFEFCNDITADQLADSFDRRNLQPLCAEAVWSIRGYNDDDVVSNKNNKKNKINSTQSTEKPNSM